MARGGEPRSTTASTRSPARADLTAVDGKRLVLAPRLVLPRLAGKARRLYGAARARASSAS